MPTSADTDNERRESDRHGGHALRRGHDREQDTASPPRGRAGRRSRRATPRRSAPGTYHGRNSDTSSATPDAAATHSPARSLRRSMRAAVYRRRGSGTAAPGLRETPGAGAGRAGPSRGKPWPRLRLGRGLPATRWDATSERQADCHRADARPVGPARIRRYGYPYLRARGAQRVHEQHRPRHRPHPARHRRDRPRPLAAESKSTSPTRPSSVRLVPTSITTAPSRTMSPVTRPGEPTAAISTSASRQTAAQVARARVAVRDGRVGGQQQLRQRLADQDRAPDHDRPGALELGAGLAQQLHHAGGRAGHHRLRRDPASAGPALTAVRPSTSLTGSISGDELVLVEVVGQRQLQQDAVHARVRVQRRAAGRPARPARCRRPARGGRTRCRPRRESSRFMRT